VAKESSLLCVNAWLADLAAITSEARKSKDIFKET
jgi:hypothetical protein